MTVQPDGSPMWLRRRAFVRVSKTCDRCRSEVARYVRPVSDPVPVWSTYRGAGRAWRPTRSAERARERASGRGHRERQHERCTGIARRRCGGRIPHANRWFDDRDDVAVGEWGNNGRGTAVAKAVTRVGERRIGRLLGRRVLRGADACVLRVADVRDDGGVMSGTVPAHRARQRHGAGGDCAAPHQRHDGVHNPGGASTSHDHRSLGCREARCQA